VLRETDPQTMIWELLLPEEAKRLPAELVRIDARGGLARRPGDGRPARLVDELAETIAATQRLLAQTDQRLAGNRVIPDRLVSLADPDACPIRKGSPARRPSSAPPCWWPRTSAASSPTTNSTRATRPTRPSSCPPSSGSSTSPAQCPPRGR
jgi:hypothetical protein